MDVRTEEGADGLVDGRTGGMNDKRTDGRTD